MFAIISALDPDSSATVSAIWQKLCQSCGLTAIYEIPTPHFTWLLADNLEIQKTRKALAEITAEASTMTLHTFGLGIFTGDQPVLYLPIVKSSKMIALHEKIWEQIIPLSDDPKMYYSPVLWVPHITLALNDLNQDNLTCAVNAIASEPIELFIKVDNLAIAEYQKSKSGKIFDRFLISA